MRSIRGSSKAWSALHSKTKRRKKPFRPMECYEERRNHLIEIGYSTYQEYLESEEWKKIRERKLKVHPDCLLCLHRKACQVHHLSYSPESLLGWVDELTVTLCDQCHRFIEYDGKRKRDLADVNDFLKRLAMKYRKGRDWFAKMRWVHKFYPIPGWNAKWAKRGSDGFKR